MNPLNSPMKCFFIALCLLLSACTGTQEVGVARLIVMASGGDTNSLSLAQDQFFSDRNAINRFEFLKELSLPASPIAYDVSDRNANRDTLVIVSQNESDTFLSFVQLNNINPEAPDAFSFSRDTLSLASLLAEGDSRVFAPVRLQVSQSARYVAITNELGTQNAIDVIDLEATGGPELLERFSDRIVTTNLYLDQREQNNRLFFFTEEASGAVLKYFNLPNLNAISTEFTLPNSQSNLPRDLSLINGQLVALQETSFTVISDPLGEPTAGAAVNTVSTALRITPSNSETLPNLLILSATELGAHRSSTSEAETLPLSVLAGTIEPLGGFAYFLSNGSNPIRLFDVQTFNGNNDTTVDRLVQSYAVIDPTTEEAITIEDAVFVTWAISNPPAMLP